MINATKRISNQREFNHIYMFMYTSNLNLCNEVTWRRSLYDIIQYLTLSE